MATDLSRRELLMALLLGTGLIANPGSAFAKDGSDDGGGSSGSGSSGSDGGDDGGGDDGGGDDGGDDSEDDDKDEDSDSEADEAKSAVNAGHAVSMRVLKRHLRQNFPGKILDIDLKHSSGRYQYRVKVLEAGGKVLRLRLDAQTLQRR